MLATPRGGSDPGSVVLPLFPLRTVLFPGGVLPLRIFEQRYITMAKTCLKDGTAFGVCLVTQGEEVAGGAGGRHDQQPGPTVADRVGELASFLSGPDHDVA